MLKTEYSGFEKIGKSAALMRVDDRTKGIVVNRTWYSVNGGSLENKQFLQRKDLRLK